MTKATCPCGATIETDSAEHLSAWAKEHVLCAPARGASPPVWPQFVPVPVPYPQIPPPSPWPNPYPWELTWCGDTRPELANYSLCGGHRLLPGSITTSGC